MDHYLCGQASLPALALRKTSLVPAPPPLSRLRDFHSIDSALRKAASQADHIVLTVNSDIRLGDLANSMSDRVGRENNVQSVRIIRDGKDAYYTRDEITRPGFKIEEADFK